MLEHICEWDPTHGWVRIVASDACKDYPLGLSSHAECFLCETCGQYASLVIESRKGTPFFRHPNGSKDCDDKLTSYGVYRNTNPLGFSLPLRIRVLQNAVEVLIGFLPLPSEKMDEAEANDIVLKIATGSGKIIRNYAITSERFSCEHITYLSIGNEISERYLLTSDGASNHYYWPKVVDGVSTKGTLFDYASGKRLPRSANVLVGRKYWLLTHNSPLYCSDIHACLEKTLGSWKLYCVYAAVLSRSAANFFLKYSARLTDKPSKVTHIWPPAIRSSHFLTHCAEKIWLYKTDGYIDMYPARKHYQYGSGIFTISKSQFEQILSLSRFEEHTSVLKYTLVRYSRQMAQNRNQTQSMCITDMNDIPVENGIHTSLPNKRVLNICSRFDGFVKIEQNGFERERIYFKGNEKAVVEVNFNQCLKVFQGLDCVAEIAFVRLVACNQEDDYKFELSLSRCSGHTVKVSHTLGALASQMKNMPKTQKWLRTQLRLGVIKHEAAMMLVKKFGRG